MKLSLSVTLDDSWDKYREKPVKLLLDDLFGGFKRDGVTINITDLKV